MYFYYYFYFTDEQVQVKKLVALLGKLLGITRTRTLNMGPFTVLRVFTNTQFIKEQKCQSRYWMNYTISNYLRKCFQD